MDKNFGFEIASSGTVKIFNKAKKLEQSGKKLIHLEVGELDFDTPQYIVNEAIRGLKRNNTRYTLSKGVFPLRREIAEYTQTRYELEKVDPETQVMVTPGAKYALFLSLLSILQSGDEVVVFSPSYPSFRAIPEALHTEIREVTILDRGQTIPTEVIFEDFCAKLSPKTRVVILNGPCNPTGQVIGPKLVSLIWDVLQKYPRVVVVADDIYEQFIYPPATFETEAHHDAGLSRTILINGLSKSMCMTGFRVGWLVTNPDFINRFERIQQNSITCVSPFIQDAAITAMKSMNERWPEYIEFSRKMKTALIERKTYLNAALNRIEGIQSHTTDGAFYQFPDVSRINPNDDDFCSMLLDHGLVITPGSSFGAGGAGHVRLSFTNSMDRLKKAVEILKHACENP